MCVNIVLPSVPSSLLSSADMFNQNVIYISLCPILVACHFHLIFLNLVILTILGEECRVFILGIPWLNDC